MKYLALFVLSSFSGSNEVYKRHIQVCSSTQAIDKKWDLYLRDNNTFTYVIKTIDSKLVRQNKQDVLSGKWSKLNNTLRLKPINAFDVNRNTLQQKEYLFIIKDGKLFPVEIEAEVVGNTVIVLDFLEK